MNSKPPSLARILLLLVVSSVIGTFVAGWFVNRQEATPKPPTLLTEQNREYAP